jgi:release factor glutamine methyltransferase
MDKTNGINSDDNILISLIEIRSGKTINQIYKIFVKLFEKYNFNSPEADAKFLLANILKTNNLNEVVNSKYSISPLEEKLLKSMVIKRMRREPLQYILGKTTFYNLNIDITKDIFIPRPETEVLVDIVLNKINTFNYALNIMDIFCGCGNIAIAIAKNSNSKVIAIDNDYNSLNCASRNALKYNLSDNIIFIKSDMFKALPDNYSDFDMIVANPPYISEKDYKKLEPEIRLYEPKNSLVAKKDGFEYIEKTIIDSPRYLKREGYLFIEMDPSQMDKAIHLMRDNKFMRIKKCKDLNDNDRILYGSYMPSM